MSSLINLALMTLFTVALAAGQLLFKLVGVAVRGRSLGDALAILPRQPALYGAAVLYGGATGLWIWILARVPLAQAYTWVIGAGLVIVPMLSAHFFGERIPPLFWVGTGLIVTGLVLTQVALSAAGAASP